MKTEKKKGGFSQLLTIAYRNIYRKKGRSALCIAAIGVTVFFIIAMAAFMEGMLDNLRKQVITFETGHVFISSKEYEKKSFFLPVQYPVEVPGKDLNALIRDVEAVPGVRAAFPRIRTRVSLLDSVIKNAVLWGVDMERELEFNTFNYKTGNANKCLVEGRYPRGDANECAIGFRLARKMGVGLGDKVQMQIVSSEFSDKYYFPVITGIADFNVAEMDKNVVIIPFARAQKLVTLQDKTQALYVYVKPGRNAESVASRLSASLPADAGLSIKAFTRHPFITLMRSGEIMMFIIYIVFMVVASFLIINTVIMMIHERIKEIGMMGALGMTRAEIVAVFFMESVILSTAGSVLGCLVGGAATFALSRVPFDMSVYEDMFTMNNTLYVAFSPSIIGTGFLFGLLVSAACTIFPSLKSAFVKPVEALRR
jgi:putative ABC transport system permease protein